MHVYDLWRHGIKDHPEVRDSFVKEVLDRPRDMMNIEQWRYLLAVVLNGEMWVRELQTAPADGLL